VRFYNAAMSNPVTALEANFDGLVGPTHNYAGLAAGNLAAAKNANKPSNPRAAAHEGLAKMRTLAALGLLQGLLPPQERPHLPTLRALGFGGREHEVLYRALREAPGLLAAVSSASSMWTANAATVSPGPDTADGRVHFTPANLASHLHRALEAQTTARLLRATFPEGPHFAHHAPLPATPELSDEGAANHTRFCREFGAGAIELFVYGREADPASEPTEAATEAPNEPHKFPARQSRAASEAVARLHGLPAARTVYARQHPAAIDAGAFHNDVVAVGHRRLLLHHEQAFADVESLQADLDRAGGGRLQVQRVSIAKGDLALDEAIASYLFNSQILSLPDGRQQIGRAHV
jgi:succinylarginine dihydrolase